jgi:hypothetical protein
LKELVGRGEEEPAPAEAAEEAVERTGVVRDSYEAFGASGLVVEADDGTFHAFSADYTPPPGGTVRIAGTARTLLQGTDYQSRAVDADEITIPVAELKRDAATYGHERVCVSGTVTRNYAMFGRSVFGVEDDSGETIEVWSGSAGHAPGSAVSVCGRLKHVAGWGDYQVVFLVQEQPGDEAEAASEEEAEDEPSATEETEGSSQPEDDEMVDEAEQGEA